MGPDAHVRHHCTSPWVRAEIAVVCVLLLLSLVGVANLYRSSRPGSEEFANSIHTLLDATVGTTIDLRTPAQSHPDEQFEFWQGEAERILGTHVDDAELFAGAALLFHEPSLLYLSDHLRDLADENDRVVLFPNEFFERMRKSRSNFDRQGSARSTELIRRATELSPDDERWWRLRAVLLWPSEMTSEDSEPGDPNWQSILREAERHDPDNALYVVLRAHAHGHAALGFDEDGNIIIASQESWRRTIELARKCVKYRMLILDEPGLNGLVRLHALSKHPRATTVESIRHRFVGHRSAIYTIGFARQLMHMADAKEIEAEYEKREELLLLAQEIIRLAHERSGSLTRYQTITFQMRRIIMEVRADLERERGDVSELTATELEDTARWEAAVMKAYASVDRHQPTPTVAVLTSASMIVLPLFATTLGAAIVLIIPWFLCGRPGPGDRGFLWPFAIYFAAISLSVLFLGAGPAGLISESVQHWILTGVSFVVLCLLSAGVAARLTIRVRFTIRSLLIGTAAVAVLLQTAVYLQLGWNAIGLPIQVHASSDALLGIIQQQGSPNLGLPGPTWISQLILQWVMQEGPFWSVVVFLVLSGLRLVWSMNVAQCVGQLLVAVGVMSLLWFNVWVWIEPANYVAARPAQIRLETYIRSIDEYYEPIEDLTESELAKDNREIEKSLESIGK